MTDHSVTITRDRSLVTDHSFITKIFCLEGFTKMLGICVDGKPIEDTNRAGHPNALALEQVLFPNTKSFLSDKDADTNVDNLEEFVIKGCRRRSLDPKVIFSRISFNDGEGKKRKKVDNNVKGKEEWSEGDEEEYDDEDDFIVGSDEDVVVVKPQQQQRDLSSSSSELDDGVEMVSDNDEQQQEFVSPQQRDLLNFYSTKANVYLKAMRVFGVVLCPVAYKDQAKECLDKISRIETSIQQNVAVVDEPVFGVSERANHLGIDMTNINAFNVGKEALDLYRRVYPNRQIGKVDMDRGGHIVQRNVYKESECKKTLDVALRLAERAALYPNKSSKGNKKTKV